ncbi:MAG TPA: hypothetical protein VGK25_09760 [Ignavibacteria bacterium]|jgi:hypothetical protein
MRRKLWLKIPLGIGFLFLAVFILMLLWNALIPVIFHGPVITFWQAGGLLILSKLLFGRFGGRPHRGGWHRNMWRRRFEEKMASMTPEEREKFKNECFSRFGERKMQTDNPPQAS